MPTLLEQIQALVAAGRWAFSDHGGLRMRERTLPGSTLTYGVADAIVIDEYPPDDIGPSIRLLQFDESGEPLHVVWGIRWERADLAWIITAYRPDNRWETDLTTRRRG